MSERGAAPPCGALSPCRARIEVFGRFNARAFAFLDGNLVTVSVNEHAAVLGLKQASGEAFMMTLGGLEALRVGEFGKGNVILSLWAVGGSAPTNEHAPLLNVTTARDVLFPSPHPEAAARYHEAHALFSLRRSWRASTAERRLAF